MVVLPFSRTKNDADNPPMKSPSCDYHIMKNVTLHKENDKGLMSLSHTQRTERGFYGSLALTKVLRRSHKVLKKHAGMHTQIYEVEFQ